MHVHGLDAGVKMASAASEVSGLGVGVEAPPWEDLEQLPVGVVETEITGVIRRCNPAAVALLGDTSESGVELNRAIAGRDVVVLGPLPAIVEPRKLGTRGGASPVLISVVDSDNDLPPPVLRWLLVGESAPARPRSAGLPVVEYVCDTDMGWTCRWVSEDARRILGISPSALTGAHHVWLDLVHEDDRRRLIAERLRTMESGEPLETEYRICLRDDRTVWVRDVAGRGEDGRFHGVLLDTSAEHRVGAVERQLYATSRAEVARLRDQQDRRDLLFRTLVHDLRATITGLMVLTREEAQDRERVGHELMQTQRMLTAVLELEETSSGRTDSREVDIGRLLGSVVTSIDPVDHEVTVTGTGTLGRVDPELLRRVVWNLVRNAVDHTPPSTTIRVDALRLANDLVITVEDDGPGIAENDKWRIFEAFQKSASSSGTGLGLALVRMLVELQGGRIWVEDVPSGGTAFLLRLPQ